LVPSITPVLGLFAGGTVCSHQNPALILNSKGLVT